MKQLVVKLHYITIMRNQDYQDNLRIGEEDNQQVLPFIGVIREE